MERPEFEGTELTMTSEEVVRELQNAAKWLTETKTIEDWYCRIHRNRDGSFTLGGGWTTVPI